MTDHRNLRAYRQTDLQTMGKEKLIVMLYRKVLEHLDHASACAATDRAEMSRRLGLAQRIITELRGALDHSVGGDVAANLESLYEFVFIEILAMQVDRDPAHAQACRQVLQPLLDAWSQIPAGTGERELAGTAAPGTEPATGYGDRSPAAPAPEPGELRVSFSA